jgi:molybdopterin-binding protein
VDPALALLRLSIGSHFLLAQVTRDAVSRLGIRAGSAVFALVKSVSVLQRN